MYSGASAYGTGGRALVVTRLDRFCAAIVTLEVTPHPMTCAEYAEEECDCGIHQAKSLLWSLVGADPDGGRVPPGHPLQVARNNNFDEWQRRQGWL